MSRSIEKYQADYQQIPFEPHQARLRREYIINELAALKPVVVVEVGCGLNPLFTSFTHFEKMYVVEPGKEFAQNAVELAAKFSANQDIEIVCSMLEDTPAFDRDIDVIIVSALLHEVPSVKNFLASLAKLGGKKCKYFILVPNAFSFHRRLAKRCGLIDDLASISDMQKNLQQSRTYTVKSLTNDLSLAGFSVDTCSDILFKPFTHAQMQKLLDHSILSVDQVDALAGMINFFPGLGSELFVIASIKEVN